MPALKSLILIAVLLAPVAAQAETCKYVDANGGVIYSNTPNNPPKGAKKVKCFADVAPPAQSSASPDVPTGSDAPRPRTGPGAGTPRVDGQTQRQRDDSRRQILQQELADEQEKLDEAREKLAEQESYRTGEERNYQKFLDRVQPFRDAVATHERNVEAIQRELANLK
jgi:hypothetical protein